MVRFLDWFKKSEPVEPVVRQVTVWEHIQGWNQRMLEMNARAEKILEGTK